MFNTNAMQELNMLIKKLEEKIPSMDAVNTQISLAKVGWHIEHSLLVVIRIASGLKQSNPKTYSWKFNINRTFIWTIGKIPRGKVKAPNVVIPKEEITSALLKDSIAKAKENIASLASAQKNHYFEHPYFGKLNLKPTIKFLKIHTKHHLKIINDILLVKA
jgi:hypothetical protein